MNRFVPMFKSAICGGANGNNPFASLCGSDTNNGEHRIAFCDLPEQLNNQDCSNDISIALHAESVWDGFGYF